MTNLRSFIFFCYKYIFNLFLQVIYPSIYPTVNQSQIHFHLHATSTEKSEQYLKNEQCQKSEQYLKNEQYLTDSTTLTPPQRVDIVQTVGSDVTQHPHIDPLRIEDGDVRSAQSQNDPSSVWRPYSHQI